MKRSCFMLQDEDHPEAKKAMLVEMDEAPGGVSLINTRYVSRNSPTDLVQLAGEIQQADEFLYAATCSKLQVIAQQVRFLHRQAENVLQDAKKYSELHHVACNFVKVTGKTYYLYRRPSGQVYFSMLSPEEWKFCPHEFLGGYRLELDRSWTPAQNIIDKNSEQELINKIFSANDVQKALRYA